MVLIHALENGEAPQGLALLARMRSMDSDGRVKRSASIAIGRLQAAGTTPETVAELKTALDKLQEDQKKLLGWVEELRSAKAPAATH
jgi:hypothetical protein